MSVPPSKGSAAASPASQKQLVPTGRDPAASPGLQQQVQTYGNSSAAASRYSSQPSSSQPSSKQSSQSSYASEPAAASSSSRASVVPADAPAFANVQDIAAARVEPEVHGLNLRASYAAVVAARKALQDTLKNLGAGHFLRDMCDQVQREADVMLTIFKETLTGMSGYLHRVVLILDRGLQVSVPSATDWRAILHACHQAQGVPFDMERTFSTPSESGLGLLSLATLFKKPRQDLLKVAAAEVCQEQSTMRDELQAEVAQLEPECAEIRHIKQQVSDALDHYRDGVIALRVRTLELQKEEEEARLQFEEHEKRKAELGVKRHAKWIKRTRGVFKTYEEEMDGSKLPDPHLSKDFAAVSSEMHRVRITYELKRKDAKFFALRLLDRQLYVGCLDNQHQLLVEQLQRKEFNLNQAKANLATVKKLVDEIEDKLKASIAEAPAIALASTALYKTLTAVQERVCSIYMTAQANAAHQLKNLTAYEGSTAGERHLLLTQLANLRACQEIFESLGQPPDHAAGRWPRAEDDDDDQEDDRRDERQENESKR